ncbi:transposase [Escherichia coli]|uniref:transposase n=1 Tax=Escherichia coli TaxID=562 RepID=UPI0027C3B290|nr:transposase [Escherichia coli]MDQ2120703.1 transposase [Escherichia coli]
MRAKERLPRKHYSPEFKMELVRLALEEEGSIAALACEPGGCSAPVAGYSACLTSFTSSIRFSLHAYSRMYSC